jgi:hypothetical protein
MHFILSNKELMEGIWKFIIIIVIIYEIIEIENKTSE